ncbi:MAG: hypothetical protein QOJ64_363 [Acidobacteriota bacterium]|nr:hypothetical protein [Acidobacteriota bacterium]
MVATIKNLLERIDRSRHRFPSSAETFEKSFYRNLSACRWEPHPLFSVFTQYDQEYYIERKDDFLHKYRSFYAVARTIRPSSIIELGTSAGSGADAYLSAAPTATYVGYDVFGKDIHHLHQTEWDPYDIATRLFDSRGFNYQLIKTDLRKLERLPFRSDLVVVDAGHDFENEYADLKLALTADPFFIFVDDSDDAGAAELALQRFLGEDLKNRVDYTVRVYYQGGGLVIKLKE